MGSLRLDPTIAYGGQTVTASTSAPNIDLTRAYAALLLQTGGGGAINVRLPYRAVSRERLEVTIPPVAASFTATQIARGHYRLIVQLPTGEKEGTVPLEVRTGAAPPAPASPPASAPAPAPGSAYSVPLPTALSFSSTHFGLALRLPTPAAPVPPAPTPITPSPAPAAGHRPCASGAGQCCLPRCCCCCCKSTAGAPPSAVPPPGTALPPPVPPPPSPPSPGSRLPRTFPPPPYTAGGSGTEEPRVEQQIKVRWVVESSSPIRTGTGPELIDASSNPEIFSSMMSGGTSNGGKIPIEPVPLPDGSSPDNPPIREYEFIVSSQLLSPDNQPLTGQKVTFRWLDAPGAPADDDSKILEVGGDLAALKRKLVDHATPVGNEYAYANAEGKAYAWVRVRLFEEGTLADLSQQLKGLKAIIGEAVKPPSYGPYTTLVRPTGPSPETRTRQQLALVDILVEHGAQAFETFGEWLDGQLEALAGLPRTPQKVLGFALKRIADGIILMFPLPGHSATLLTGFEDELRATITGLLLGVPRGLYAMARDSIQDLTTILIDLPRALFNFVAEDPKFALQVLGSIVSSTAGTVFYTLDAEFRDKINKAISRFTGFLERAAEIIGELWAALRDRATFSSITSALGSWLYSDFSQMVGGVATDYLDYTKDSDEYRYFVGGFIAGDLLGYVLATVGVELLMAWFTGGIGNMISATAKMGRLGAIAGRALQIIRRLLELFKQLGEAVADLVAVIGRGAKSALGTLILGLFKIIERLVHPIAEHVLLPFLEALFDLAQAARKKLAEAMCRWSDTPGDEGIKIILLADSLVNELTPPPRNRQLKEVIEDYLDVIADTGSDVPGVSRNTFSCAGVA